MKSIYEHANSIRNNAPFRCLEEVYSNRKKKHTGYRIIKRMRKQKQKRKYNYLHLSICRVITIVWNLPHFSLKESFLCGTALWVCTWIAPRFILTSFDHHNLVFYSRLWNHVIWCNAIVSITSIIAWHKSIDRVPAFQASCVNFSTFQVKYSPSLSTELQWKEEHAAAVMCNFCSWNPKVKGGHETSKSCTWWMRCI